MYKTIFYDYETIINNTMEKELKQLETALDELHISNDVTNAAYSTLKFALQQVKKCIIHSVSKSEGDAKNCGDCKHFLYTETDRTCNKCIKYDKYETISGIKGKATVCTKYADIKDCPYKYAMVEGCSDCENFVQTGC